MDRPQEEWTVERLCRADELDGVMAVEEASYFNPWTRAMFSRELKRPEMAHLFVVRGETRRIAGYCSAWVVRQDLHINNLAVGPPWRRRGAARALLWHMLQEGQRRAACHTGGAAFQSRGPPTLHHRRLRDIRCAAPVLHPTDRRRACALVPS